MSIKQVYTTIIPKSEQVTDEEFNRCMDINFPAMYKGVLIGFYSCGDPGCEQYEKISNHIKNGCRIILCACRNWGQTRNDIENVAKENGFDIIYTSTHQSSTVSPEILCKSFVLALIDLIESCLTL